MKRKPRSLDKAVPKAAVAPTPVGQKFVVFTDLHVSARTLDRACEVLRRVGALAVDHKATIVCLGDFWDARGVLSVRHVHAVMDVLDEWRTRDLSAVFVPGNHDQVTIDGAIHGMRVFDLPHIVVSHGLTRLGAGITFVPWREDPDDQRDIFANALPVSVLFGHAEVGGAVANSGKKATGRVSLAEIEKGSSACYLGHYHRRQKLGAHTWYIGSPFEQDIGERGQPHGVAVITIGVPEPQFVDWDDFPQHHDFEFGPLMTTVGVRAQDIVRVSVPADRLGTPEVAAYLASLPAKDVRTATLPATGGSAAPTFAIKLDDAIGQYVKQEKSHTALPAEDAEVVSLGQALLHEVPESRTIVPLHPDVQVKAVHVEGFLAIRGPLRFEFGEGTKLIRGAIGSGKTSLMDAVTWGLYGATSPRKAGSHGATLRADEVVHDDAPAASVSVFLDVGGTEIRVVRTKKRGQGSRVTISGVDTPAGISDQQELVNHAAGLDLDLWRTCVSLGQGAVGNFVTDADKSRKDLLSNAFGLAACALARKLASEKRKLESLRLEKLRIDVASDERVAQVLRSRDYVKQIADWDANHKVTLASIETRGKEARATVEQCDQHLAGEAQWAETKQKHEEHVDRLVKSLARLSPGVRSAELQRLIGASRAEQAIVERELAQTKIQLTKAIEASSAGPLPCPVCGRPFDDASKEQHVSDLEKRVLGLQEQMRTFEVRVTNYATELDQLLSSGSSERDETERQLVESREHLAKCADALTVFARIKANRATAMKALTEARAEYERAQKLVNPFAAEQAKQEEELRVLDRKLIDSRAQLDVAEKSDRLLAFWQDGFGPKGIPVLVLRTVLHELETLANRYLSQLLQGRIHCQLAMEGDDLRILLYERDPVSHMVRERRYEQLSGGQRRCVELAFHPFALSELIFGRCGVRVGNLIVDELTAHLGADEKPIVCSILRALGRRSVVVIDHDMAVQGEFDAVVELKNGAIAS